MSRHRRVMLTKDQRTELEKLVNDHTMHSRVVLKARILLMTDRASNLRHKDIDIINSLGVSICTIIRTRKQFIEDGLNATLYDKKRDGKKPKITPELEKIISLILITPAPNKSGRWTIRGLADRLVEMEFVDKISTSAVYNHMKTCAAHRSRINAGIKICNNIVD